MIKVYKSEEYLDVLYKLVLRPLLDYLMSFVFYVDTFQGHYIVEESNLFLMKPTLLHIGKQQKLLELL